MNKKEELIAETKKEVKMLQLRSLTLAMMCYEEYRENDVPEILQDFYEIGERVSSVLDQAECELAVGNLN